ncbi:MAG: ribulose-phosphate 3-epimerase [Candidatus Omnitrophota bacterium]
MKIKVAPSLLSADFSCLAKEINSVQRSGADMLHIDVMDGHFVPNITIGPVVVKYIKKHSHIPLDVHLMIENPEKYIGAFIDAGSDMITVHIEAIKEADLGRLKSRLKARGVKLGISLNPATPISRIRKVLKFVDFVLVMSVNPGFGGQKFMPVAVQKIRQLRRIFKGDIAIDGGINNINAKSVIQAGANILAAGSYIFGAKNKKLAIERIRNAGEK